eukprot:TRINITY_DN63412_c0_g1_i1.p1 TRINITY_DN63412_c0_g1~~TRINITY_DN63412_c0_g1_i1.p1  ORF type:complete len:214 (+),score=34.93 TRINITY_DN63412_c0_g1_i1:61-702(+)
MSHVHNGACVVVFFFKQKTAYEMLRSLVGSEMCIRDSSGAQTARAHAPVEPRQSHDRPGRSFTPRVGESVRRHLKGQVAGNWQDLLDACDASSMHETQAAQRADQAVQGVIADDAHFKVQMQRVAMRETEDVQKAVEMVRAVMKGIHARKQAKAAAAVEVRMRHHVQQNSTLNYLNLKYASNLHNLEDHSQVSLQVATQPFKYFDRCLSLIHI